MELGSRRGGAHRDLKREPKEGVHGQVPKGPTPHYRKQLLEESDRTVACKKTKKLDVNEFL